MAIPPSVAGLMSAGLQAATQLRRRLRKTGRRLWRTLVGRVCFPRPSRGLKAERLGSDYGGWYVAIEPIHAGSVVYSFGVGEDASFELALIERFGVAVHAFDPTPKSIEWVKHRTMPSSFVLHEVALSDADGQSSFNPPLDENHVSFTLLDRPNTGGRAITVNVKRLSTIMRELGHSHIDLLKMDIEGAEYQVVDDLVRSGIRPTQVLVEFHHRFSDVGLGRTRAAIREMRAMGYELFAISPSFEEFSFVQGALFPLSSALA